jgi:formiminoglutamase
MTNLSYQLYQVGIHDYANSKSTLSPLTKTSMQIINLEELAKINFPPDALIFFSLDADAIESSQMEAVSAVNHSGLTIEEICMSIQAIQRKHPQQMKWLGIYEYNPVFDNLSCKGARGLAHIIYQFLKFR